jgi:hypothetical protein
MTRLRSIVAALPLALVAGLAHAQDMPTHCRAGERVVFSCRMTNGKVASICGPRPTSAGGSLQYRFGHPGEALELRYPESAAPAAEHFRGATLLYSGGGGAWLAFDRGGFSYFVYTAIGKDWQKEGVSVRKGDDTVAALRCRGAVTSDIGPALFAELDLPAGADEFEVP